MATGDEIDDFYLSFSRYQTYVLIFPRASPYHLLINTSPDGRGVVKPREGGLVSAVEKARRGVVVHAMQERPLSHASSLTPSSSTASSTTSFFPSISDPPTSSSSPSSSSAPFHMILCSFPPSNASGSSTSCSSHHLLSPSRLLQGTRNFQISAIFLVLILLNAFPVRDVCYMILLTYQQVLLLLVTEHFFAEGRVTLQN